MTDFEVPSGDLTQVPAHRHLIQDVDELLDYLNSKAEKQHGHAISDVSGLSEELTATAKKNHSHAISDVSGLSAELEGKASASHEHEINNVKGLQLQLDGKAMAEHRHDAAQIDGITRVLQTQWNPLYFQVVESTVTLDFSQGNLVVTMGWPATTGRIVVTGLKDNSVGEALILPTLAALPVLEYNAIDGIKSYHFKKTPEIAHLIVVRQGQNHFVSMRRLGDDATTIDVIQETTDRRFSHVFKSIGDLSGYSRAAAYALESGIPGECVSAQHLDATWGVYQIQNNKTLELVGWYHTSFEFTSDDLDNNGCLAVAVGAFPIAVKGGGEVVPVCPSQEDAVNQIYLLNLKALISPGVAYTIVTIKE